jgi:putative endonuclease
MWHVYILRCFNNGFYTGYTQNIERRILEHNSGKVHFTKNKRPVELISYISFKDKYKAFEFEKYLKSGSGAAFRNKRLI